MVLSSSSGNPPLDSQAIFLFGADFSQECFGLESLNPQISGWPAVWAVYSTVIQYIPILISLGFVFLSWFSKSTMVHFLGNTVLLAWIANTCLEYRFQIEPENEDCIAKVMIADIQLLGPTYALPPLEITQSLALCTFFIFYLFFWRAQWWSSMVDIKPSMQWVIKSELQEKTYLVVFILILIIQNPLLLYIRSVYTIWQISIGVVVGLAASVNLIFYYVFFINSYILNQSYHLEPKTAETMDQLSINFPFDDPFYFFHLAFMPDTIRTPTPH